MRTKLIVGLALGLALSLAAPAVADTVSARDPQDGGYRFDIRRIRHGHGRAEGDRAPRLQHTVRFRRAFTPKQYRGNVSVHIVFPDLDRGIRIVHRKGQWRGVLFKPRSGKVIGHPKVWRPDDRTLRVSFRKGRLQAGLDEYRWSAYAQPVYHCPESDPGEPVIACSPMPPDITRTLTHSL